ncbi:hypothetical protein MUK42_13840 [Musa troglodytarum]|uniref:Uncharacterized protein n=1 Tax=Musa troglodytarum TaxID=320322 RepID=A0A9E7L182_9LILI|nr:hypothetical protein MUK42_13840 [Musa troglodytarum]
MIFVWVLKDASFEEKVSCFLGKENEKADSVAMSAAQLPEIGQIDRLQQKSAGEHFREKREEEEKEKMRVGKSGGEEDTKQA